MNTGQLADLEKLLATWVQPYVSSAPIHADYNHEDPLPYIIIAYDNDGPLYSQEEVHGVEPGIKVEIFCENRRQCLTYKKAIRDLFRHTYKLTLTGINDEVTIVRINKTGGSMEIYDGELGYWTRDWYTLEILET